MDQASAHTGSLTDADARLRRYWLWYLAVGLAAVLAFEASPVGLLRDSTYVALALSSGAFIALGVRLNRPTRRAPWYLMAAAQFLWAAADAVLSWESHALGNTDFPSIADVLYLSAYPLVFAGLLGLIRGRRTGDLAGVLDSTTVTAGLGVLSWVLLARPTVATYEESVVAATVALAYPLADIVLVGMLIRLLTMPGGRTASFWLLFGAVVVLVAVDTLATASELLTAGDTSDIDYLWLVSYVLWGAAALHPSMTKLTEPATDQTVHLGRTRLVALSIAVLIAPATLAAQSLLRVPIDVWAVVVGSVVMFLLVVARMRLALRQSMASTQALETLQHHLAHQATHDMLTGLPNRSQAMELIRGALSRARRSGAIIGLLFVDLDGFKAINDTLGHGAGDEVLKATARRMQTAVRGGDVVARLGGDEFVVLLEPLDTDVSAVAVADRLVAAASEPVALSSGQRVRVGASIGVAISQDAGIDAEALLHEADVAVYRAKSAGKGRAEVFDSSLRSELQSRAQLEAALSSAVQNDELSLVYQHIVSLQFGGVEGCEAFVRWNRPGQGTLLPSDFLPVAERSDLICAVDAWVLSAATRQLAEWCRDDPENAVTVAVNVSGRYLARSQTVDDVSRAIAAAGLRPQQLVLEITEQALGDDPRLWQSLDELRARGVRISLDDYAGGASSLARLEQLPVDIVKIDKRFLGTASSAADKLLPLVVQAAHAFGKPVVAEGVERIEQFDLLLSIGCESAQGYFFGRPVPAEKVNLGLGRVARAH